MVDKETGISNVYMPHAKDFVGCSCVPITKVHKVHIKPSSLNPISKELAMSYPMDQYAVPSNAGMNEAHPPVQWTCSEDPTVEAAVRFCDDVLASPKVGIGVWNAVENVKTRAWDFKWKSRTVTIPITDSSGEKALSMIIEVPKYFEWHGSIVTAEGVCVARISQKISHTGMNSFSWDPGLPTPVEWGGARFGEVTDATKVIKCCDPSTALPAYFARGPGDRIYFDTAERHPTKVKLLKAAGICALPCFGIVPGLLCLLCANISCCYPTVNLIKESAGGKVIGKNVIGDQCMCGSIVLHYEGMTSEQRRLALVAVLYNTGIGLSTPPISQGGGGGEG